MINYAIKCLERLRRHGDGEIVAVAGVMGVCGSRFSRFCSDVCKSNRQNGQNQPKPAKAIQNRKAR